MHILLLNYEFPPMGGGAGNATWNIARALIGLGVRVDVLTSRFESEPYEEIKDGVRIYRVRSFRKGIHDCGLRGALTYIFFALFKSRQLLKENRYDALHFFFSFPTGLLSLALNKKIPYIVSLRGSDVPGYDKYSKVTSYLHRVLKPINLSIWRNAGRVIALSEGLKKIASLSAPELEMGVIHNGIDSNVFYPEGVARKRANNQIKLICVSRLLERKGIQYLLQALADIRKENISLEIVGEGSFEANLKAMTLELELTQRVHFAGYCPRQELYKLYNQSDIFVLPSLTESFGLVFAEAMACGLPIIGTRVGGIPEIVLDNDNGILVPPHNVEALKEAILSLADDPALRKKIGRQNVQRIRKKFSWKIIATEYLEEYRQLAQKATNLKQAEQAC